ncbi:MAG: hypothetical protein C4329_11710 [Chitinophagaceae bacterium]
MFVFGKKILLYENDHFLKQNLVKAKITEDDVMEELRIKVQMGDLPKIDKVNFEKTGEVGFIKKD